MPAPTLRDNLVAFGLIACTGGPASAYSLSASLCYASTMTWNLTRRQLLVQGANLAAAFALVRHHPSHASAEGSENPKEGESAAGSGLLDASVNKLARAIRGREISSQELVRAYLERIEATNPWLNAVVRVTAESALVHARQADAMLAKGASLGPLHGIPMTIKDSLNTAGVVTTGVLFFLTDFSSDEVERDAQSRVDWRFVPVLTGEAGMASVSGRF